MSRNRLPAELISFVILTGFALLLTACQHTQPTVEDPAFKEQKTLDDTHPRARLILGSEQLFGRINLSNVDFRKVGKFTQAQIGIQNLSNARYDLEYRVEWENADGFMVDQSGVWRRFTLAPTQIDTVTATGKVPEAYQVVFTVRLPDDYFINRKRTGKGQKTGNTSTN